MLYGVVAFLQFTTEPGQPILLSDIYQKKLLMEWPIAGKMMPAVGFAMLLRTMFNVKLLPHFSSVSF